jgi:hypothetical protein
LFSLPGEAKTKAKTNSSGDEFSVDGYTGSFGPCHRVFSKCHDLLVQRFLWGVGACDSWRMHVVSSSKLCWFEPPARDDPGREAVSCLGSTHPSPRCIQVRHPLGPQGGDGPGCAEGAGGAH